MRRRRPSRDCAPGERLSDRLVVGWRLPDCRPPPPAHRGRDGGCSRSRQRRPGARRRDGRRKRSHRVRTTRRIGRCHRRDTEADALAKERCAAEGVEVDLRVGNAMALGVEDDSFDVVLSVLGVMFAPDPDVAIAELARAVRPGGVVASRHGCSAAGRQPGDNVSRRWCPVRWDVPRPTSGATPGPSRDA